VDGTTTTSLGYLIQATITHTTWLQYPGLLLFPIMIVFVISFFAFLICYKFANALNPNAHN
jgi:ABC-type dipeptide/oligopeptide/nickel transport system permease subunit